MPKKDGYSLVRHLRQQPEFRLLPVVFLTERGSTEERIQGYQVGCDVYLPKPFEMDELQAVVRNLLERSQMIQSEWRFSEQKSTVSDASKPSSDLSNIPALTEREIEVLEWLAGGLSNSEIGNKLHLSPRTIEKHVSSLLRKTETNNRAELVRFALEHHLID
jgi:DNA-binding NarL/FixJ family response regulator